MAFFTKEIVKWSQRTVSLLPNNLPQLFPTGAGRELWGSIKTFFVKPGRKGKAAGSSESEEGWALSWLSTEVPKQHKKASEYLDYLPLLSEQGKTNRQRKQWKQRKQQKARNLHCQRKRQKIFDKVELVTLDQFTRLQMVFQQTVWLSGWPTLWR